MNQDKNSELNEIVEKLIQDPELTRRLASAVLLRAEFDKKPANNERKYLLYGAAAIFFIYFAGSEFINFIPTNDSYNPLTTDSALEVSSPEESEEVWRETDNLILTTFGSR